MKIVHTISKAKFKVSTPDVAGSELELDFNPIIEQFSLSGSFTLIHWQARPKGHREFGIYHSDNNSYRCLENTPKAYYGSVELLMLDDSQNNTIPSAVILHRGNLR
ncbi:hypothetical protein I4641_23275 [Waterburya agarophytonicola K14]|uniref:Uncharacterized protein n=1 Tax=Waterburya agarophytonicola KI4 TaxID=2874699 RepID=A0A964FMI1_9CYAN|nr:hypothetical protein [Waterburya agarophytonicola]MCC0179640.1 hypothetical protein [Waterburya agarophytonicola KI4]MCC0179863.1 hypothetical protein [Waterburya agarophytonicola KI4]